MPVDVQVVGYGRHEPAEGLCCAFVKGNFVYEKNWEMILKRYDVDIGVPRCHGGTYSPEEPEARGHQTDRRRIVGPEPTDH